MTNFATLLVHRPPILVEVETMAFAMLPIAKVCFSPISRAELACGALGWRPGRDEEVTSVMIDAAASSGAWQIHFTVLQSPRTMAMISWNC